MSGRVDPEEYVEAVLACVEQVLDLRADVGHARPVLEAVRDHLHDALQGAQRRVRANESDQLIDAQVVRLGHGSSIDVKRFDIK